MKWKKIVCESTSTLNIDYLIECAFEKDLNSDPANEVLRDNLNHYDFQDTDGDNQTECYFYFPKDIDEVTLGECKDRICDILGLNEYEFGESKGGDDSEIRIDAVCHIEI